MVLQTIAFLSDWLLVVVVGYGLVQAARLNDVNFAAAIYHIRADSGRGTFLYGEIDKFEPMSKFTLYPRRQLRWTELLQLAAVELPYHCRIKR